MQFATDEAARYYLAALFDGEGTIGCYKRPRYKNNYTRQASISNTDIDILLAASSACDRLGIKHVIRHDVKKKRPIGDKAQHRLEITGGRQEYAKLQSLPMAAKHKVAGLQAILDSYLLPDMPSRCDIEAAYNAGTLEHVAVTFNVSAGTSRKWLLGYGIRLRKPGQSAHGR